MAQSVEFRRNREKPAASLGHRSRLNDEDSVRAPHQGQQSTRTAPTGRTHDCKRPLCCTPNDLLPGGGHPHMRRREFTVLLGGAAAWPLAARAQQREQMRRIGVLMSAASETDQQAGVTLFLEVLHKLGWIDSHNVRVEIRWARGDPAEARKDAEELVALPADVIMVTGQLGLEVLLRVTHSVPIVFNSVIDPVGGGQIDSLARPGGNATGFITFDYALAAKWAELLKEIAPTVTRVAVLRDSRHRSRNRPIRRDPIRGALNRSGCECDQHARCSTD